MKLDNQKQRSVNILGDEDTQGQVQAIAEDKEKLAPEDRKKMWLFALIAGIALLAVVTVLVVGILYSAGVKKEEAARAPRDTSPIFTASLAEKDREEGKITSAIIEAYYTVENGMMVTIEFANDTKTDEHISKVVVTIWNEKEVQIAKAQSAGMKLDFVVSAGDTNEITMYIKPEYVSVTDDPLKTIKYEITVEHETRE